MGGWSEDRVYVYHGCDASELDGSRGTEPRSSSSPLFDDYGRSIGLTKERGEGGGSAVSPKVVRVVPKVETSEDVRNGVHKFRLKLLPEGAGSPMDVLCQVPDEVVSKCTACAADSSAFNRRNHCRSCGDIFCDKCTQGRTPLTTDSDAQPVRVCDKCVVESIVLSIISMFSSPNDESPANIEAAKEWREKRDDFKKMDRCIVRKYQEML